MPSGYFGKMLMVDLSKERIDEMEVDDDLYKQYLGGYGLGVRLLLDIIPKGAKPLGADNVLGLLPGLLTGFGAPFSGRFMAVGKSPLTNGWGDSNAGGYFGPEIRKCGYDGLFFKGESKDPVYLAVTSEKPEIFGADRIWGKDCVETEDEMNRIHGKGVRTASVGPAGEKVSLISGIVTDRGRVAARSGLGAVMGSKRLKAVVLKGSKKPTVFSPKDFYDVSKKYNQGFNKPGAVAKGFLGLSSYAAGLIRRLGLPSNADASVVKNAFQIYGTTIGNTLSAEIGDSPVKNWKGVGYRDFPLKKSKRISGQKMLEYVKKPYGCSACPLRCGALMDVPKKGLTGVHRPEYETSASFGTLLLNDDVESLIQLSDICNRSGLDTISAGMTVAFAMECYEKGILDQKEVGFPLEWGNARGIVSLLELMVKREGVGDILADGVKVASTKLGKNSHRYAVHASGQELPMHDSRLWESLAFTYAYDPTPGRHTAASIDFSEMGPIKDYLEGAPFIKGQRDDLCVKAKNQKVVTGIHQAMSSAGLCLFSMNVGRYPMLELVNSCTGWNMTVDELLDTGWRIQALRHMFSVREGINPLEGKIHPRALGKPPLKRGPTAGVTIDLEKMKDAFCQELGYDSKTGLVSEEEAERLGIENILKQMTS